MIWVKVEIGTIFIISLICSTNNVIIEKSRSEVSLMEQDTIDIFEKKN